MDTSKDLVRILGKIASKAPKKQVVSLPQRPRSLATEALKSDEVKHLAKHIIKITLWPQISYRKHWLKEIRASLNTLTFKLCRFSNLKDQKRYVEELWYGPEYLMRKLNERLDDAYWEVVAEMKSKLKDVAYDPFVSNGGAYFSDIGYAIKAEKDEKGIVLNLYLKKERVI